MVSKKVEASNDVYYRKGEGSTEGSRINLNDLLKKVKDRERHEKKINLLILSGALSVAAIIFLVISF